MKFLAVVPSNQDSNRGLDGYREMAAMHAVAKEIEYISRLFHGELLVRPFFAQEPESKDPIGAKYFWLRDQCRDALRWLTALGVDPADGAIVHIHSDSGQEWSHVLGCYGSHPASRQLADSVSAAVEEHMETGDRRLWDYSGWIFDVESGAYPAMLGELGSHQSSRDIVKLRQPADLAHVILKGALRYFDLGIPVEVQPEIPDEVYWGYLRNQFGEIPYYPEAAIARNWRAARRQGDMANFGPAVGPEEPGERYGELGKVCQRFANGIMVVDPANGWHASRLPLLLKPADSWTATAVA